MDDKETLDTPAGSEVENKITDERLALLIEEANRICDDFTSGISVSRAKTESVRMCLWDGQSEDSLKWTANLTNEQAEPFDGSCDMRFRLTDMLTNEQVMAAVVATMRGVVRVKGMTPEDAKSASAKETLLRWVTQNLIGSHRYMKEIMKLAQYVHGDTPALGLMKVWWHREYALSVEEVSIQDLMDRVGGAAGANGQDPDMAMRAFMEAVQSGDTDTLQTMLQGFFEQITPKRAKKVAKELMDTGSAKFPIRYIKSEGPDICAKRAYEDFAIPTNTTEFQEARAWFERELMSRTQVEEKGQSDGWSKAFIDQVLEHEASVRMIDQTFSTSTGTIQDRNPDDYRGLYEVWRGYYKACDDDGIPARYYVTFHMDVKVPAHPERMLDYKHGKYPGHLFQREVLTSRPVDSRSITQLSMSEQGMMKVMIDGNGNNALLGFTPPVISKGRGNLGSLYIAPMAELSVKRDSSIDWMSPPSPVQNWAEVTGTLKTMVDEYHGRANKDIDPSLTQIHREYKIMWWLVNMAEVYRQIIQLCQQFMTDEQIQRITGRDGEPIARSVSEIQGDFDLQIMFDPRDMDPEYISSLADVMMKIVNSMDRSKIIDVNPIVASLMYRIAPDIAEVSIRDEKRAAESEIDAERLNYQQILGGEMPEMVEDGSQDYQTRLAYYEGLTRQNPVVFNNLPEDRQMMLNTRIEHLRAMVQQYNVNAQTGRQGVATPPPIQAPPQQAVEAPAVPEMAEGGVQ